MPNKVKVSTTKVADSIRKGNLSLGIGTGAAYGPTKTGFVSPAVNVDSTQTLWWNGIDCPVGGYTLYHVSGDTFIPVVISNDANLVSYVNTTYGQNVSGATGALNYIAGRSDVFATNKEYPPIVTNGLVAVWDSDFTLSYPKGATVSIFDLGGSGSTGTLTNGATATTSPTAGIVWTNDATNDLIAIPGNAQFYGGTQGGDFTWQGWMRYLGGTNALYGYFWSEGGGQKNFLFGYSNINVASSYVRLDTSTNNFFASDVGTRFNGFVSTAGPILNRWLFTTLVKKGTSGPSASEPYFDLYWDNATLMWASPQTVGWDLPSPTLSWTISNRNDGSFPSNAEWGACYIYNRALTPAEISNNYNATKSRYGF